MAEQSPQPRRRTVALILLLVMVGSCGVSSGIQGVAADRVAEVPTDVPGADNPEAVEVAREVAHTLFAAPLRRPLAAVNIVVSALLLVAGWAVATGRPSYRWWVTQAALTNAVWTGLETGSHVFALLGARDRLVPLLESEVRARVADDPTFESMGELFSGPRLLYGHVAMVVIYGLVRLLLYAAMLWLSRRLPAPAE